MNEKETAEFSKAVVNAVLEFVTNIPRTAEVRAHSPHDRARVIVRNASLKASMLSGTLSLPAGPAGALTIVPDLIGVWRIQAQMVADLAGAFGKTAFLGREQMLYCLFRHAAAQAVRDLVVRVGERTLVRRVSLRALQVVAGKLGLRLSRQLIAKWVARIVPLAGAIGVGAYAYVDTGRVAATAIELFENEISVEDLPN